MVLKVSGMVKRPDVQGLHGEIAEICAVKLPKSVKQNAETYV